MSSKELYRFLEGTETYAYTSSNEQEVFGGDTYLPETIGRDETTDSNNSVKATLKIRLPLRAWMAQHILASGVDSIIRLELYTKDEDGSIDIVFRGRLSSPETDNEELSAEFENVFSANRQVGARPLFQRTCRHCVFGPRCKVNIDDFKLATVVTAISADGLTLTMTGMDARNYLAGVVVLPDGTMRYITGYTSTTVTLIRGSDVLNDAFVSGPVDVYIAPGCNQTMSVCGPVFNNMPRFGGFPWIPYKNPFDGSSIITN